MLFMSFIFRYRYSILQFYRLIFWELACSPWDAEPANITAKYYHADAFRNDAGAESDIIGDYEHFISTPPAV